MPPAAVTVYSFDQACAALRAAAELNRRILLVSPPDAGISHGAAWFLSLVAQARHEVPAAKAMALLDCGDKPGAAMAAFRMGAELVYFDGSDSVTHKLAQIANAKAARLLTERPAALDLLVEPDPADACRRWLRQAAPEP